MIDAEIELVMNPGGVDVGQKRQRLVDEIVVIEQAAARLFLLITRQHSVSDDDERSAAITADDGVAQVRAIADASLFFDKSLG